MYKDQRWIGIGNRKSEIGRWEVGKLGSFIDMECKIGNGTKPRSSIEQKVHTIPQIYHIYLSTCISTIV